MSVVKTITSLHCSITSLQSSTHLGLEHRPRRGRSGGRQAAAMAGHMVTAGCRTRQGPAQGRTPGLGLARGTLMQGRAVPHRAGDTGPGLHKDPAAVVRTVLGRRPALGSVYRSAPWPACSAHRPRPAPCAVQQRSPAVSEPRAWELEARGKHTQTEKQAGKRP